MTPPFVDTNVLLYRFVDHDGPDATKRSIAREIVDGEIVVSVQVLQEFYYQATRQSRQGRLSHESASQVVRALAEGEVQELTPALVMAAIDLSDRFQTSYWDAAIIEAARARGCETVLSEDLGDGQDYGGVRVENPFRDL